MGGKAFVHTPLKVNQIKQSTQNAIMLGNVIFGHTDQLYLSFPLSPQKYLCCYCLECYNTCQQPCKPKENKKIHLAQHHREGRIISQFIDVWIASRQIIHKAVHKKRRVVRLDSDATINHGLFEQRFVPQVVVSLPHRSNRTQFVCFSPFCSPPSREHILPTPP